MKFWIILKISFLSLLFFSLSQLNLGCGKKADNKKDEPFLKAYRLIDEQRTDEAIELLEDLLSKEPKNIQAKSVLASAYAHKSGVKIQKLIPVLNQTEKLKQLDEKTSDSALNLEKNERVNASAIQISNFFSRYSSIIETYALVPLVNKEQSIYLQHAIYLLNSIGNEIHSEDVLYRAILEIILFKYVISDGLIGEFIEPQNKTLESCKIDLSTVSNSIIKGGKLLIDIFNDFGFANPKQSAEMRALSDKTAESISNLTLAVTAVAIADEASNIFLKNEAIQHGFGKAIKCGSE